MTEIKKKYKSTRTKPTTKLGKLRIKKGMSQAEFSEAAGISVRAVQMYEQRERPIEGASIEKLCDMSNALGCNIDDILEDENVIKKVRSLN